MATREEWKNHIVASGGKTYSARVYGAEELKLYDVLDYHWTSKDADYLKVRNRYAKKLRKDGFNVKSSSSSCMGLKFAELEARREKN